MSTDEITVLLRRCGSGDRQALEQLTPLVFDQLRQLADRIFRRERPRHTLQPAALVNELFERLIGSAVDWHDRNHFFALSARMMRRVLVNHAARGDHATAPEYFRRGLEGFERSLGLEHPFAAPALAGMAQVLAATGEVEEAEHYYRRALGAYDARGEGRGPAVAAVLESYAALLRQTGRADEAAGHLARAARIRQALAP